MTGNNAFMSCVLKMSKGLQISPLHAVTDNMLTMELVKDTYTQDKHEAISIVPQPGRSAEASEISIIVLVLFCMS